MAALDAAMTKPRPVTTTTSSITHTADGDQFGRSGNPAGWLARRSREYLGAPHRTSLLRRRAIESSSHDNDADNAGRNRATSVPGLLAQRRGSFESGERADAVDHRVSNVS